MLFRLAAQLGRTVGELVSGRAEPISSRELTYWRAFDTLQPIGAVRDELHAAMIATTIANTAGRQLEKGKNLKLQDFMWWSGRGLKDSKRDEDTASLMSQLLRAGAKVTRKRKH